MSHIDNSMQLSGWTFLSNYSHVLICLAKNPAVTMRDVAAKVGITERAVQRIIAELEVANVVVRTKSGRQNSYAINHAAPLRHPLESDRTVGDLLRAILKEVSLPEIESSNL